MKFIVFVFVLSNETMFKIIINNIPHIIQLFTFCYYIYLILNNYNKCFIEVELIIFKEHRMMYKLYSYKSHIKMNKIIDDIYIKVYDDFNINYDIELNYYFPFIETETLSEYLNRINERKFIISIQKKTSDDLYLFK